HVISNLFPYTTLFRSGRGRSPDPAGRGGPRRRTGAVHPAVEDSRRRIAAADAEGERGGDRRRTEDQPEGEDHDLVGKPHEGQARSEEHTSELQSRSEL